MQEIPESAKLSISFTAEKIEKICIFSRGGRGMLKRPDPLISASSETMDTKVISVIVFQFQAPAGGLDRQLQENPTELCQRH